MVSVLFRKGFQQSPGALLAVGSADHLLEVFEGNAAASHQTQGRVGGDGYAVGLRKNSVGLRIGGNEDHRVEPFDQGAHGIGVEAGAVN